MGGNYTLCDSANDRMANLNDADARTHWDSSDSESPKAKQRTTSFDVMRCFVRKILVAEGLSNKEKKPLF